MGHGCHDCGVPNGCECPGTHGDWYNQRYELKTTTLDFDEWLKKLKDPKTFRERIVERSSYCTAHRKYRGKGRPRLPCEQCWRIYFYTRGEIL